jgi:hypothetical protein
MWFRNQLAIESCWEPHGPCCLTQWPAPHRDLDTYISLRFLVMLWDKGPAL